MAPRTVNSFLPSYAKQLHEMDSGFPENLHCHVFRHSIGMAMYKAGIPISYIKDFLGHSSLDSTAIYAHADSDAMAEALRSVDQEALPVRDDEGNIVFTPEKKWKGKEEYLLHFCGRKTLCGEVELVALVCKLCDARKVHRDEIIDDGVHLKAL